MEIISGVQKQPWQNQRQYYDSVFGNNSKHVILLPFDIPMSIIHRRLGESICNKTILEWTLAEILVCTKGEYNQYGTSIGREKFKEASTDLFNSMYEDLVGASSDVSIGVLRKTIQREINNSLVMFDVISDYLTETSFIDVISGFMNKYYIYSCSLNRLNELSISVHKLN